MDALLRALLSLKQIKSTFFGRWEFNFNSFYTLLSISPLNIFCVCVKRITLCNCLCSSSSCFSASVIRNIVEFGAKSYFTDHWTANTIHGFRDLVPALKYTTVIRIRKNWSNFPFLQAIPRWEQCVDVNNPLQTISKHFKLYILTPIVR